jgi:hypothetical protein
MRGAVLHLGDLGVGIGPAHPVRVGELLPLAGAIDANKIVGRRRLDPALLGHALQHLPVGLACVPADDRPQRGIGLHRRGVDADPLAVHQTVLGDARQHPAEHLLVDLLRQAAPRLRQPGMVRNPLGRPQTQKLPERQRVGAAPLDPPLGVDPLEVADHVHPEVPARWNRWRAHLGRIVRLAGRLRESVEAGGDQHPLKPIVEDVPRRARHLLPRHHQITLPIPLPTQRHPGTPQIPDQPIESESADFVNGLLG